MPTRLKSRLLAARLVLIVTRLALPLPTAFLACASTEPVQVAPRATEPPVTLAPLYTDLREEGEADLDEDYPRPVSAVLFVRRMGRSLDRPVRNATPSPDGAHIAFIVPRRKGDKAGQIWISRADGSLPYVIHSSSIRARQIKWCPGEGPEGRIHFISRGRTWSLRPILLDE
jgi:hypothetical protein